MRMTQQESKNKITGKALLLYLAVGAGILMYVATGIKPIKTETTETPKNQEVKVETTSINPIVTHPTPTTSNDKESDKVANVCYQWNNLSIEELKKAKTLLDLPAVTNISVENNQKYGVAVATPEDEHIYEDVAIKIKQVGGDPYKVITLKSGKEAWPLLVTANQQQAQDLRAKLQKNNIPGIVIETKAGPQNITFYSTSPKVVQKINEYAISKNITPITYCSKK